MTLLIFSQENFISNNLETLDIKFIQGVSRVLLILTIGVNVEEIITVSTVGKQSKVFLKNVFSDIGAEG